MSLYLDFERQIIELEGKIEELRHMSDNGGLNIADEVTRLQGKVDRKLQDAYKSLTPQQKVKVARHPERPQFLDYAEQLFEDFTPLAGDRLYAEDEAVIGGFAKLHGQPILAIGHHRGRNTEERVKHNFGMAKPEGYRKCQRLVQLADRYGVPVVMFIDTTGAYPGKEAEERGQSEAIAKSIEVCLNIKVPSVAVVLGEGGSGGAIAIGAANKVLMLEHSIYSVISPEGCASILWRSADKAGDAAAALKLTAQDLLSLKVIDQVIAEPVGGAHRHKSTVINEVGKAIMTELKPLLKLDGKAIKQARREKFLEIGRSLG